MLSLAACAPDAGLDEAHVIGGVVDTGHPAVGAIIGPISMCTGTLIDECTVLTAAHCVRGGAYRRFVVNDGRSFPVDSISTSPDYVRDQEAVTMVSDYGFEIPMSLHVADLAILKLAEPCPDIEPIPLAAEPPAEGDPIAVVGYGLTDLRPARDPDEAGEEEEPGDGEPDDGGDFPWVAGDPLGTYQPPDKYIGYNFISQVTEHSLFFEGAYEPGTVYGQAVACSGDSGGPILRRNRPGVEEVVGVNSKGACEDDLLQQYRDYFEAYYPEVAEDILDDDFDWRMAVAGDGVRHSAYLRAPASCMPGATMPCGDDLERECNAEGMWSARCE